MDIRILIIIVIIALLIVMSLSGCASLHERFCEATVKHYEQVNEASEGTKYFEHYREVCYKNGRS